MSTPLIDVRWGGPVANFLSVNDAEIAIDNLNKNSVTVIKTISK